MKTREIVIRRWFDMWLQKKDLGISEMFSDNAVYIESWGPEYHGSAKIKLWFDEWNTRGTVLQWDIKQFFHKENQTMVEWYFKNQMNDGKVEAFHFRATRSKSFVSPDSSRLLVDAPCAMSFFTVCLPWGVCFARCALAILRPTARRT